MIHTVLPVRFDSAPHRDFQDVLKQRAYAYLGQQPNGIKANTYMWVKVWTFIVSYWAVWASLALFEHGLVTSFALIVTFATLNLALAYNVSHDAVHSALSHRRWVNELFFYVSFNSLGPSSYLWRLRHRIMHHNCVNIPGLDYNIEASDILRFSPTQTWRPIHRFQHLYAPFAYVVFTIHWVFVKDFQMLRLTKIGNLEGIEHPPWRILELVAWKVAYILYMLVIPTLVLDYAWWQILLGFAVFHVIVSFQFVLTFTGSHLNEGLVFVPARENAQVPHSFIEHQLRTSMDFHPRNPLVSFFLGGFNAHVAHHIFPQVCSTHYPALTKIIQETCEEYSMPYLQTDMVSLYISHFRYLKQLGQSATGPNEAYLYDSAG
jgi:linoleoyl-CoA desaturase